MPRPEIKIINCSHCQGKGCVKCNNIGVFLKTSKIFYWGPQNPKHFLLKKRIQFVLEDLLDALAFTLGAAALIYEIVVFIWEGLRLSYFLGLGVLSLSFAFYRLLRRGERQKKLGFWKPQKRVDVEPFLDRKAYKILLQAKRLEPLFLLTPLLETQEIEEIIARLGLSSKTFKKKADQIVQGLENEERGVFSPKFKKAILTSFAATLSLQRETIRCPELFLGITKIEPKILALFEDLNLNFEALYNTVDWVYYNKKLRLRWKRFLRRARFKPGGVMNRAYTSRATPLLDRLGDDLTLQAKKGALPLLVNRQKEIKEILANLRQADGNVILKGKPGVGKSAVVYGIANLMAEENVPHILQDKRLVSLDVATLISQGSSASLLQRVISEVQKSGNIILFIDNISNLIGLGAASLGLDAAEILMSVLAHPTVHIIGISTEEDYHNVLERRGDFLRRFQVINIEEPDDNLSLKILEREVSLIEYQEEVFFTYPALEAAISLSQKYIYDTYLPAKALNLLSDAASFGHREGKRVVVRGKDVIRLIEEQVKVPLSKVAEEEKEKLLNLEKRMHKRIVNQEEAVSMVAEAMRRARAGMRSEKRPICSLLFVGPTGVGKTETAKALAEIYFGAEERMVRLDMSEYQGEEAVNKLIGPPPGFTGAERGGYLTEAIRKNPFSLLLLDELEKAHPNILNAFLQVIEDGRLTDSRGKTIDFTNTIIIATSNAGTQEITKAVKQGQSLSKIKAQFVEKVLSQYYRLELLNRFDGIVLFRSLSWEHVLKITKLMLDKVAGRLQNKNIRFSYTEEAVAELAQKGFDPVFGARPLRRVIQNTVDNALAKLIISGKLGTRDVAVLGKGSKIIIREAEEI